jgi:hypothetical protein
MIVVGGTYLEKCDWPERELLMGPGSRAALAISRLSKGSELYTYCFPKYQPDLEATMESEGVRTYVRPAADLITFFYKHPLTSPPDQEPPEVQVAQTEPWTISGKTVLAFGLVEARVQVSADRAVFEMSGDLKNIIRGEVKSLALIAGENDLSEDFIEGADDRDAAARTMIANNADLMIVRRQAGGAVLYHGETKIEIPAYTASEWFKIGAGNVFCGAFAHYWGEVGLDPQSSADLASRNAAYYAGTKTLPLVEADALPTMNVFDPTTKCKIFIVSPCYSMAQQWLLDQAIESLRTLNVEIRSPYDLGLDGNLVENNQIEKVLEGCNAVLVLAEGADIPSVLAVGLGRVRKLPIVVLAEEIKQPRLELWQGTDCEVAHDFATAVYRAMVAARRNATS